MGNYINVEGELIGKKRSNIGSNLKDSDIIHIKEEFRPSGPAENSIIIIYNLKDDLYLAQYLSWVGYFDLDREIIKDKNNWEMIYPGKKYIKENVQWQPFNEFSISDL